ncbi:hypothetical protein K450DRAFT_257405 [Umbelopsis ramanniana AG]|uniref:Uncharacterized protein n=1 Tax=Umbelopsis ramanniana AG TaxID=1314678 RepID=A0AAD5H9L2_UMBRA|nr:uncharacterized protein K450DRAFT_257405 [Umbelopsis ramanniana AG]KAI8576360.1 hypothetical protein K450DRAFT_257405 [Umbelopsis ramanniana AG]
MAQLFCFLFHVFSFSLTLPLFGLLRLDKPQVESTAQYLSLPYADDMREFAKQYALLQLFACDCC